MSEATITFADHDQIRALFGTRDEHLRQIRDSLGIEVVVRGDELRLQGDEAQIKRGLEVFAELRSIVERHGRLLDTEVKQALYRGADEEQTKAEGEPGGAVVDLFEKAKRVHPRSPGQAGLIRTMRDNDMTFCVGPAGCGKTYLAVAMGINALRTERVRKIVLARPAVEAGEKLGFLPGDLLAKVNPYLRPLLDSLNDLLDFEQVKRYMESDVIEIVPLAFMRGRTLNNTFIILDEGQNTTVTQMKMFLTRMGLRSKIVVTGDITQLDLPPHVPSGLVDAIHRLNRIEGVGVVELTGQDIVRHRLVRDVVAAYEEAGTEPKPRRK